MEPIEREESPVALIEEGLKKYATKTALIYLGQRFNYAELKKLIDSFATALANIGINENDKVIIYLPNTPQWVIAFLATIKIGAVPVPISPIYTPIEVAYMSNDCGAETIVCLDTNFGYVKDVIQKSLLKRVIYTNLADMLPWWKRVVGFLFDQVPRGVVERHKDIWHFMDLLKYPPKPPQAQLKPREHIAFILYTGGTSGFPKGVPWSHWGLYNTIQEFMEVIKYTNAEQGGSRFILQLPLFHIFGIGVFSAFTLGRGNTAILIPQVQVDAILECVQRYKSDLFLGVPALYRMILENDRIDQYDLTSLRYALSGADILPIEVSKSWTRKFGIPLYQAYGATEANLMAFTPANKKSELTSLGVPLTSTSKKYKFLDPDTLSPVPPGRPGELFVSASFLPKTYLNKPEETAASFVDIDGDVYYRTKDVLEMREGELYFLDRSADVIKYKGYRIAASEIEAVLQDHPGVIGACAVGVPDAKVGERIKAFVILKDGVRGVGSQDLIKHCRERLTPYKVPHYIEFRDMLPKSKVGKLLRREVRDEERRKVGKKKE